MQTYLLIYGLISTLFIAIYMLVAQRNKNAMLQSEYNAKMKELEDLKEAIKHESLANGNDKVYDMFIEGARSILGKHPSKPNP